MLDFRKVSKEEFEAQTEGCVSDTQYMRAGTLTWYLGNDHHMWRSFETEYGTDYCVLVGGN